MDRRSKILAGAFGVLIAYGLIQRVVYPRWIEPALLIDQLIAERQEVRDELEALEEEVRLGKHRYRELASRNGSFDAGRIETEIRDRLNKLIAKHNLQNMKVSRTKPARVGKTELRRMRIVVKAEASLQAAVEFLRDVSELPQLMRLENVRIYPAGSSRKRKTRRPVNLTVPIELWLMPQQKLVGRIDEASLTPPEVVVRHEDRDYSSLWEGRPFSEYVKPVPLVARAGSPVSVTPRKRVTLSGTATGGERPYAYKWSPMEGLSTPNKAKTRVDTSKPVEQTYTLEVTDVNGKTAIATVHVMVREPPPKPTKVAVKKTPEKPRPKPKPVDPRWKQRKFMQLRMALLRRHGDDHLDEVMVYDRKKKKAHYFAVGDDFDGGELVFVHPSGGVVRRTGEYFIYPIGTWLDGDLNADDETAGEYPTLRLAADRIREVDEQNAAREQAEREKAEREKAEFEKAEREKAEAAAKAATEAAAAGQKTPEEDDLKAGDDDAKKGEGGADEEAARAGKKKEPAVSVPDGQRGKKTGAKGRGTVTTGKPKSSKPPADVERPAPGEKKQQGSGSAEKKKPKKPKKEP